MRLQHGIFATMLLILVLIGLGTYEEKRSTEPEEVTLPAGLQIRVQELCLALKSNPDVVMRDVAFLQFQYSLCEE